MSSIAIIFFWIKIIYNPKNFYYENLGDNHQLQKTIININISFNKLFLDISSYKGLGIIYKTIDQKKFFIAEDNKFHQNSIMIGYYCHYECNGDDEEPSLTQLLFKELSQCNKEYAIYNKKNYNDI